MTGKAKYRPKPRPPRLAPPDGDPRGIGPVGAHDCPGCGAPVARNYGGGYAFNQPGYKNSQPTLIHTCPANKKETPVTTTLEAVPTTFAQPGDGLQRDRWDRPLIIPAVGGERIPYTRASSMSDFISDDTAIRKWSEQHLARGLAMREDLCAMISGLPPLTGNAKDDRETKAALTVHMDEAREAAAIHAKANWGTAMHSLTDPHRPSFGPVPERMRADYASYEEAMVGLRVVATECFVVNDELRAAGTFDKLVQWPGMGTLIADTKTGSRRPHKEAVQLAVYAGGDLYDGDGDVRTPLPNDLNREWGLVVHIPAGEGRTTLSFVDLVAGRSAALRASWVRDYQAMSDNDLSQPAPDISDYIERAREEVGRLLEQADCKATMSAIRADHTHVWSDALTAIGVARLAILEAA